MFGVLFLFFLVGTPILPAQDVLPLDRKGIASLIEQRSGKILVLNIWATWCQPCKEEFPDLIALSDSLKNSNVEVIALSVDYPDEIASKIVPFLHSVRSRLKVFVAEVESQDEIFSLFKAEWSGAIPATFIFDASGKERRAMFGKRSYAEFLKAVEEVRRL
jgi:thiol-disulfide isomerase/thioredoxin